jgi:hypothetical protein
MNETLFLINKVIGQIMMKPDSYGLPLCWRPQPHKGLQFQELRMNTW